MTNNMIPEDAVERGARVLIEDGKWGVPWEDASEEDQEETKDRVRAILEAALLPLQARQVTPEAAVRRYAVFAESEPWGRYGLEATTWLRSSAWQVAHDLEVRGIRTKVRKLK